MGKQLKSSFLAGNELVPSMTKNTASDSNPHTFDYELSLLRGHSNNT
jgi:hypothetical protein